VIIPETEVIRTASSTRTPESIRNLMIMLQSRFEDGKEVFGIARKSPERASMFL
jgi:hypothetical protein